MMKQKFYPFFITLAFIFFTLQDIAQVLSSTTPGTTTFTPSATGTYTIQVWGAGASGCFATSSAGVGGGGGGGAYASKTVTLTGGVNYTYTVGAGGASTVGSTGNAGGFSSFGSAPLVKAVGGSAPSNNSGGIGGLASACTGTTINPGNNGEDGYCCNIDNTSGDGGDGANPGGGHGGLYDFFNEWKANPGAAPGGGGSGASEGMSASGSGGNGRIIIWLDNPLPLHLLEFEATENGNGQSVRLYWKSAQEINLGKYVVERSADANHFIAVGEVVAKGFNNTTAVDYTLMDDSPLQGVNFYRLKMVDTDGKFSYSKIVRITRALANSAISVYPNPNRTNQVSLTGFAANGVWKLKISFITGNTIYQMNVKNGAYNMPYLLSGIYILTFTNEQDGSNYSIKYIKQ